MNKTPIEWTDATWNPVTGCTKVSPGCANCYAEKVAERFWPQQYVHTVERGFIAAKSYSGERMDGKPRAFTDVMTHEDRLDQPLRWRRPRRVFVNSMSDLFHEDLPFAFVKRVWDVIAAAPQHTFQILTKRPARLLEFHRWLAGGDDISITEWPRNAWIGVSVENQRMADERIPLLLQTPAAVRFISAEPLLGPVDLRRFIGGSDSDIDPDEDRPFGSCVKCGLELEDGVTHECPAGFGPPLGWVIVGGESGHGARPFNVAWARSIVQQCHAAAVPVFVKQLGADPRDRNDAGFEGDTPGSWPMDTHTVDECARPFQGDEVRVRLRDRKGGDPSEWPADLRVRQFPTGGA